MEITRKNFIKTIGMAGVLGSFCLPQRSAASERKTEHRLQKSGGGKTILFQGDSITDGKRSRNKDWNHVMGHGYAYLIASRLWYDYVHRDLMFYNRGISGNKVKDLEQRWQEDTLDLHPDVLSVLIGVNDVPRIIAGDYSIENWRNTYSAIIERTQDKLPDTQIILCEPFILPYNWSEEKTKNYQDVITNMQETLGNLAKEYNTILVKLQQAFVAACEKAPVKYWVWDGIHPMPAGHELIARQWMEEVKDKMGLS